MLQPFFMKFLSLYILLFSLFGSHVYQFLQIWCVKYFVVVPSCVVDVGSVSIDDKKPSTSTHLPKPATHFNRFFKRVKTFPFVKRSTKYDIMQNVKTLQIHYIKNSDFDTRNSDYYGEKLRVLHSGFKH